MRVKRYWLIVSLCVGNMFFAQVVVAFGPISHHGATVCDFQPQASLPDLWTSSAWTIFNGNAILQVANTEYFSWSHACLRNGTVTAIGSVTIPGVGWQITPSVALVPLLPNEYNVPEGLVEIPESDMWVIYSTKLLSAHKSDSMRDTLAGFACHNVEDAVVHWDYFSGGSATAWVIDHAVKEMW
jgi:hypothetical protein